LDDLAELGSQTTGRTYTYICGSSSLVPVLISKNAVHNEELRNEFPFVSSAPILNGKKYVGLRVHRGLQNEADLEIVKKIYNLDVKASNLVYYLCGSNLRSVDQVVTDMQSVVDLGASNIKSIKERCDTISRWDQRAIKTRNSDGPLINALLNKMVEVNFNIIKRASMDVSQVSNIDWIRDIRALTNEEILIVCTRLHINHPQYTINLLVDKGYFSGPPQLSYLLPNKPSERVDYFPKYQSKWISTISTYTPMIGTFLASFFVNDVLPELTEKVIKHAIEAIKNRKSNI